jgi:hypothetical protein
MIPTWSYLKDKHGLYVNMFVGSRINVGEVAGTDVEVIQKTDYPWKGTVAITVNPREAKNFSVYVRIPDRSTSKLYTDSPAVHGVKRLAVNGREVSPEINKGYAVITREWKTGDRIELELPMEPQRITPDERIKADLGDNALRFGPLIYSVESVDNANIGHKLGNEPLSTEWKGDLLGGVVVVTGKWEDGSPMTAIPNYARMNRVGPPPEYPDEGDRRGEMSNVKSKVWI